MELILWRHAEAEIGEPDLGRKLTPKGEKQARRMSEWIHTHLPQNAKIYVSPAMRAQQTASALADISHRKLRTMDEIAPGATADEVLAAVDWPKARATIVIVGHQPTLSKLVLTLMGADQRAGMRFNKGAIAVMQLERLSSTWSAELLSLISPSDI